MNYPSTVTIMKLASVWVAIFTVLLLIFKRKFVDLGNNKKEILGDGSKAIIFWIMAIPIILSTLYVSAMTVRENIISVTGGPVHWHADYEVWACGEKLDLVDPVFPRNKIGSPLFHEHNDDRIHIEGTVHEFDKVSLGAYFAVIKGELSQGVLTYPTVNGVRSFRDGNQCGTETGKLNVYINGDRIDDYEYHLFYPDAYVPPGDCVIVEFSPTDSMTTDKICSSWVAKDWSYENYGRDERTIGDKTWR